ncbi:MAG: hypothetical protein IIT65_13250, partial [Lachnospiraceae bacterium]|nr:hypothetical protein [Lachnospiraceae bacterium]
YGWNNFKHEVLFDNLNEISAKCIEVDLIYYYKQLGISYNILKVVKVKVVIFHLKKQLKSIIYQWH